MIQLTNPIEVAANTLGAPSVAAYDKIVFTSIQFDVKQLQISGTFELTSSNGPAYQPLQGTFFVSDLSVNVMVPALKVATAGQLTEQQKLTMRQYIQNAQDELESGLAAINMIFGAFSPGA